jgi:CMP-N-acetylneuraminic acid synthetase
VPFLRPKKISSDNSIDYNYILHATKYLIKNNYTPDLIVFLRPSMPNKDVDVFDQGIRYFVKNIDSYDFIQSVSEFNQPAQKFFMI